MITMENSANKNRWIEEVLNSTKGMSRAQPPADIMEKINLKIRNHSVGNTIAFPVKQWIAAAILLVLVNAGSVIYFAAENSKAKHENISNPFATEIQSASTYNY